MTKKKTYRVVCPNLDVVLFIKGLTVAQEEALYLAVRDKLKKDNFTKVDEYKTFLVRKFLVDVDDFFNLFPDYDVEELQSAVSDAYECIIGIYRCFSLEFICNDLNAATFLGSVENDFLSKIKDTLPEIVKPELSSIKDIDEIKEYFQDNIIGQEKAISTIINSLKLVAAGLSNHSSFLFVGPTGVGKTQVGKLLGEKYSGNFFKVNCAEYAGGHEYAKLIGSPPGYVGHTDTSLLFEKSQKSNRWVFLFDEIEKAHHKLYDFLLSLLDDGTCTDNMGNVLDFSKSIFIFTSNQGVREINNDPIGFERPQGDEKAITENLIKDSVKKHFSPEFLNRIDDMVIFNSLSKKDVREIAKIQADYLPIDVTKSLLDFIAENGYSKEYGARNISRFIKNNIADKVADAILHNLIPTKPDAMYTVRIIKGKPTIIDTKKFDLSSS